jgi:hypothetical protein
VRGRGPRSRDAASEAYADYGEGRSCALYSQYQRPPVSEAHAERRRSPQESLAAADGIEIDWAGSLWEENGLICASESGEPLDRRSLITHRFKPLLK